MKITLIENGLDSLRKGYVNLARYENLVSDYAGDPERFSALKDTILSIQHGIEILFKFVLKEKNELLLFTDISKLKEAYKSRREGNINEIYEHEGVHTITFKESIDRLRDICGVPMDDKFVKTLKKVEAWRNTITHSGVILREAEVSSVLIKILAELDVFFGPLIGDQYLEGQGRPELDRAYLLTKAVYGEPENKVKALTLERLIYALKKHGQNNVVADSAFYITDAHKAFSILSEMQGGGLKYGCDFNNGHNSGDAHMQSLESNNLLTIEARDINTIYQFYLESIVVYIPEINNDVSPMIFMYSENTLPLGGNPFLREEELCTTQHGVYFNADESYHWEKEYYEQSVEDYSSDEPKLRDHKETIRFITQGLVCFMNVQQLEFGHAHRLMDNVKFKDPDELYQAFKDFKSKKTN